MATFWDGCLQHGYDDNGCYYVTTVAWQAALDKNSNTVHYTAHLIHCAYWHYWLCENIVLLLINYRFQHYPLRWMVKLGAIYRLCVSVCLSVCLSVCTALFKKVVSPNDCKITKWISLAQDLLGWINLNLLPVSCECWKCCRLGRPYILVRKAMGIHIICKIPYFNGQCKQELVNKQVLWRRVWMPRTSLKTEN